ncbi:alpha-L-fucosidase [Pedobacter sp. AW1-32]|uniref:alpha-L-fucosidase n=1 Tax=Pedobacter sp. AW1-32 TaxID=3383026 RepID=UPI003FEDFB63
MIKIIFILFLAISTSGVFAQQSSFVKINPQDSEDTILTKAANVVPSERQLRWQKLELTTFFHFGINTFTNREWGDGKEDIHQFNPKHLDAEQWVRSVRDAGFKQVILTAKHHDGFCLWPSKYTEHSIKNTPYKLGKGDVVCEVAEACRKLKVGFGIYLSPWDRHEPTYGTDDYNDYFVNQLTELLTQYGQVDEVWFDGANGEGPNGKKQVYDFDRWYTLIRKLQPKAVIAVQGPDVRWVGTETGVGRETEWSVLPIGEQSQEKIAASSQQDVNVVPKVLGSYKDQDRGSRSKLKGAGGLVWYPAETDVSIRPGWFYHASEDVKVKTAEQLLDIYFTSVGRNGVLLLNIPPDTNGRISKADVQSLKGFAKKMKETFKHNVVKQAKLNSDRATNLDAVLDGNVETQLETPSTDTTLTINFDWEKPQIFNVIAMQENIAHGQRVEKFAAEYLDGQEWKKFASGTTIGFKRIIRFDSVTAQKVRLRITSSRKNPLLSEFGLYFLK